MAYLDINGLQKQIRYIKSYVSAILNSPALTGTPTAPTPTSGDNSTKIATTAFVQATANAMAGGAHTHNTSNIVALTGYEKPETTSALSTSDTLNDALGKLERALDGKQNALDELTPEEILVLWNTYFRVPVTVTVSQSTGQTITVTVNETDYTATFTAPTGAEYTATLTPDTGYIAGTLSSESGTLTENVTISATAATLQTFTFTLPATENQTITLTYTEPDSTAQTITSTNTAQEITLDYGTTWTATVEGATGYAAGTLSAVSGTITDDVEITITEATVATFDLTLAATENQTITLTYTEPNESAQTITSTSTAQTVTVDYGTTWTATVEAAEGYNAGTLSADSGTVTDDITISVTEASEISESEP